MMPSFNQPSFKPSYALDSRINRGWELRANNVRLEELLQAYAQIHHVETQDLEWFTATNAHIGITYTYGRHPNALPNKPYDGIWKREQHGGGSVVVAYAEEPETQQIYVGILWQHRALQNPNLPVLAIPRGYSITPQANVSLAPTKKQIEQVHLQTAFVELREEMVAGNITPDMFHRLGPPLNPNNSDVDTSGDAEGVYFYRIELPWTYLGPDGAGNYILRSGLEATESILEGITQCQFRRLRDVLTILDNPDETTAGCAFTEIGIGRLVRYLQRKGYVVQ
jgi:hypothetical protein